MNFKNTVVAEQFVACYGPATPFHLAPLFHVTLADARKLRGAGDAEFCKRGTALRLSARCAGRTDIITFALPTDTLATAAVDDTYQDQPDKWWHGNSLRPTRWLMDANAWDMFWAKVVTSAWHGFVKGTKSAPVVRTVTAPMLAAMPHYVAENI